MVTMSSVRARRSARRPPAIKPPETAFVNAGSEAFRVPCEAVFAAEYPLLGFKFQSVVMPRLSKWQELRSWLAVELRLSGDSWIEVWSRCKTTHPVFFRTYDAVALVKPSRTLPTGTVIFETTSDILRIPEEEVAYLPDRSRAAVQRCFEGAMRDFPDMRPLRLLKPVYIGNGDNVRPASLEDVLSAAHAQQDELALFCAQHSATISVAASPEHFEPIWQEYERLRWEGVNRVTTAVSWRWRHADESYISALVAEQLRGLAPLARKLDIPLGRARDALVKQAAHVREAMRQSARRAAMLQVMVRLGLLKTVDPLIVIDEPAWRLPEYGDRVQALRTIVHWDDNGVTLL